VRLLRLIYKAVLPVGSVRRDRLLTILRSRGLLGAGVQTSYERWSNSIGVVTTAIDPDLSGNEPRHVHIVVDASDAHATLSQISIPNITRTLISLTNQTHPGWSATLPPPEAFTSSHRESLQTLTNAEPRFRAAPPDGEVIMLRIRIGDRLHPNAVAILCQQSARVVSMEFDLIDAVTGRTTSPALVGPWEPDMGQQFDFSSMCCAVRVDASGGLPAFMAEIQRLDWSNETVAHLDHVLVHRLVTSAERDRGALPANHHGAASLRGLGTRPSAHWGGGLHVVHSAPVGTRALVVVRDPIEDARLRAVQRSRIVAASGTLTQIDHCVSWASDRGAPFPELDSSTDVVAIVDGGLSAPDGWLDELVGVLLRPHVFAAAPLITVPSGIVIDAGIQRIRSGLRVRSGRTDLAPLELARCRQTATLSGRALVLRRSSIDTDWAARVAERGLSQVIEAAATGAQQRCLVWAHQRWRLDVGLHDLSPVSSPMLAWGQGRLGSWHDAGVMGHEPEPGRAGEGVW
jgi:hypothetical protein